MFSKKGELKGFAEFLGKHLYWLTLLQKELHHSRVFVSFAKFLRKTILKNTDKQLLLCGVGSVIDDLYSKEIFYWY